MPELPEVETIRRYLHEKIMGKTIVCIDVLSSKSFIGSVENVLEKTVVDTYRKGKVLNITLDDGTYLNIHLKMSGQLLFSESRGTAIFPIKIPKANSNMLPARTTRVIIDFTDGACLFFNDLRKFGWVKHSPKAEGTNAPDVTRPEFTLDYFSKIVRASKKPLKTLLLDQEKIAGIGNIYANDALFLAGVQPLRSASTLTEKEIIKLYNSIISTIQEGLLCKGTSATEVYVSPDGTKGTYQEHFKVYSREGKPCLTCGTFIQREKHGGRSSFYCPHCQT